MTVERATTAETAAASRRLGLGSYLAEGYWRIFGGLWPAWVGGFLLGLVNIALFTYSSPWFIYGGFKLAGSWLISLIGIKPAMELVNPLLNTGFVEDAAIIVGALISCLLASQFRIRVPRRKIRLADGFVGGLLMGFGAMLAPGCNIGGLFTAIADLSLSGFVMLFSLAGGAYISVLLVRWRVKREMLSGAGLDNYERTSDKVADSVPYQRWRQPLAGLLVLLASIIWFELTLSQSASAGIYLLFGLLIGIILQRSGFCFTASFRDMFTTGDGRMARGAILATGVAMLGFAILQGAGLRQPFLLPVGWHTAVGGLVFGFGMVLAGGCASGTLLRIGEGSVQLLFALFGGILGAALTSILIAGAGLKLGPSVWLVDKLGWQGALFSGLAFLALWLLVVQWNQWRRRQVR